MRLLVHVGQHTKALETYHRYERIAAEELGTLPSEALQHLYRQIESGELVHEVPYQIKIDPDTHARAIANLIKDSLLLMKLIPICFSGENVCLRIYYSPSGRMSRHVCWFL